MAALFPHSTGLKRPGANPPAKAPRPRGVLGMMFAALVVVLLPFVYVAFLAATGWALLIVGDAAIEEYTVHHGQAWWAVVNWAQAEANFAAA